jgi:Wall-associated receptor kinase galacturonan-binding
MAAIMILIIRLLLFLQFKSTESVRISLPGCQDRCGGIPIPYPFGIGTNCSMEGFEIFCNATNGGAPMPFVTSDSNIGTMTLLNISISLGQARVGMPISFQCYNDTTKANDIDFWYVNGSGTPFKLNYKKNKFTVVGCNTLAYLQLANDEYSFLGGCVSACGSLESLTDSGSCSGVGCCQTAVPKGINFVGFWFDERFNNSAVKNFSMCGYATVVEDAAFVFKKSYITTYELNGQEMPAVIDWAIGKTTCEIAQMNKSSYACRSDSSVCLNSDSGMGYLCNCSYGYQGNPYLEGGCKGFSFSFASLTFY